MNNLFTPLSSALAPVVSAFKTGACRARHATFSNANVLKIH
jgi:hypothetical protein